MGKIARICGWGVDGQGQILFQFLKIFKYFSKKIKMSIYTQLFVFLKNE
jgi:hypothetical protein